MISTTLDGVDVRANDDGNVSWMSDWARCDELADAGLLRRVNYGPATYGHTDFFLVRSALDYRTSQPGDHAPAQCAAARSAYDARSTTDAGGYHAGWGICAGRVAAVSPFVRRALARALPAKEYAR